MTQKSQEMITEYKSCTRSVDVSGGGGGGGGGEQKQNACIGFRGFFFLCVCV